VVEYSLHTPAQVAHDLASRAKALRLLMGWKQTTLAERAGVSLGSLRRFETTGHTSLQNLLKIAFVLHRLDDFVSLLDTPEATSIAELEAQATPHRRKRGVR